MFGRLFACALLSLTAAFSAAQEIRVERVSFSAPVAGAAAAAPLGAPALSGGLKLSANPSLLSAPYAPLHDDAPSAAHPAAAPAAVEAQQAIAAAAASAAAAVSAPAVPAPAVSADSNEVLPKVASPSLSPAAETHPAPAADAPHASELDREGAARDFSALLGERLARGRGDVADPAPAVLDDGASSPTRLAPSRGRWLSAAPAVAAAVLPAFHPSGNTWHALSMGGYVAGNVGAAIFPLVQIYQALHGKSTPRSRAIVGAAASLALGLICAPILHKTLWGIQNLFGGLTLLVPLLLGALKGTAGMGPLKATAVISAAALAVSAAAYFAAAASVPALLGALFSAAAIAKIAMAVQFATSAMFLWMFLPDTVKVLRGKAAGGFSPGFNLMFFLSAVGCMIWAVPSAWIYSGADQDTYRLIFGVNSIYALASFISFWFAKREAKP